MPTEFHTVFRWIFQALWHKLKVNIENMKASSQKLSYKWFMYTCSYSYSSSLDLLCSITIPNKVSGNSAPTRFLASSNQLYSEADYCTLRINSVFSFYQTTHNKTSRFRLRLNFKFKFNLLYSLNENLICNECLLWSRNSVLFYVLFM